MGRLWFGILVTLTTLLGGLVSVACSSTSPRSHVPDGAAATLDAGASARGPRSGSVAGEVVADAGPSVDLAAPRGEIVVTAKLTGITQAPRCGDVHTTAVMRYEVASIVRGTYASPLLYAVFDCGQAAGQPSTIRIGDWHRLVVEPLPPDFHASIYDDFGPDATRPRLLAIRAEATLP